MGQRLSGGAGSRRSGVRTPIESLIEKCHSACVSPEMLSAVICVTRRREWLLFKKRAPGNQHPHGPPDLHCRKSRYVSPERLWEEPAALDQGFQGLMQHSWLLTHGQGQGVPPGQPRPVARVGRLLRRFWHVGIGRETFHPPPI